MPGVIAMMANPSTARQAGISLVEVLVTLLILAIGLLGMAGMQVRAQQAEMESYQRAQALILLEDMASRMAANKIFRTCYKTATYLGQGNTYSASGCSGSADADLQAWDSLLKGSAETLDGNSVGAMIGARGCITGDANEFLISVAWQGLSPTVAPTSSSCGEGLYGDDALRRVVTRNLRFAVLN